MYNLVIDFIMCNFARIWICSCLYGNINNSESVMKHLKNKTNTVWMISHKCIVRLSSVKCIDKEYQSFQWAPAHSKVCSQGLYSYPVRVIISGLHYQSWQVVNMVFMHCSDACCFLSCLLTHAKILRFTCSRKELNINY